MSIETAPGACEAVGWAGAFGFASVFFALAAIVAVLAWHDVAVRRINKP